MKKEPILITLAIATILFFALGNTHRILPANYDPCQSDITHQGHINDLPMFHCIGHTEYQVNPDEEGLARVKKWDHIHTWMDLEWHLDQGFTNEHARKLIDESN